MSWRVEEGNQEGIRTRMLLLDRIEMISTPQMYPRPRSDEFEMTQLGTSTELGQEKAYVKLGAEEWNLVAQSWERVGEKKKVCVI